MSKIKQLFRSVGLARRIIAKDQSGADADDFGQGNGADGGNVNREFVKTITTGGGGGYAPTGDFVFVEGGYTPTGDFNFPPGGAPTTTTITKPAALVALRRGTTAEWADANPILADGEVGIDQTLRNFKVGDGVTTWNDLTFWI